MFNSVALAHLSDIIILCSRTLAAWTNTDFLHQTMAHMISLKMIVTCLVPHQPTETLRPLLVMMLMLDGSLPEFKACLDSLKKTRQASSDIEASNLVADSVWTANTVDVLAKFSGGTLH
ncbi:hypothetical protein C8R48DRAFT_762332 [Suillus tomentosus]|nr:hypothetical protein C8R48DRAFT_762332 [Suillus tomentosus]